MPGSNGSKGPLNAPDYNAEIRKAQETGDFAFVFEMAKQSHRMLVDFRDVIKRADFSGADTATIATGLNFLENMIIQSSGQINALKRAEKESQAAVKATEGVAPMHGSETPEDGDEKQLPVETPSEVPTPEARPEAPGA